MGERLAAFVGTLHSCLKKAWSPGNHTPARGVPKGPTPPHVLATLLLLFPWGTLPPVLEQSPSRGGTAGRAKKSSVIVLGRKLVYSFCPVSAFRARTRTLGAATPAVAQGRRTRGEGSASLRPSPTRALSRGRTELRSFRRRGGKRGAQRA